jgi:hypothetical protein
MTKEALKLALEALEADPAEMVEDENGHMVFRRIQAIITLREALANEALNKMAENARELGLDYEPEQEPVAWMFQHEETGRTMCVDAQQLEWAFEKGNPRLKKIAPLYTTPPQRKPLTEKELNVLGAQWHFNLLEAKDKADLFALARAIEAAHGIKGEA